MFADGQSPLPPDLLREKFREIAATYEQALTRLAVGYERSAQRRKDLVQEIFVALWRALPTFEGRASLRTWVFRVAHNTAATFALREERSRAGRWRPIDEPDLEEDTALHVGGDAEGALDDRRRVQRIAAWVRTLAPIDRQLVLLQLEGLAPAEIHDVTGLSLTNVSTKLSRLRAALRAHLDGRTR